jgi:hypothetical protein
MIILPRNNTLAYPSTFLKRERERPLYILLEKFSFYLFFEICVFRASMMGCARVKKEIKFK